MRRGSGLGLRGRLALSIGAIVTIAFAVVFIAVKAEMDHEAHVITREEGKEQKAANSADSGDHSSISPIEDARSDVEKTFVLVGGATLVAALLAGYLLAARTAWPLRRFAETAARIDAGDLTPRLEESASDASELRTLAEAFNHMLDRLDDAFARQREFVSDASHELRSPLTAIRGQLEVLARQDSPSAAEVRRVERVTVTEIRRVERLVEDLMALTRLDEGVGPAPGEIEVAAFLSGLTEGDGEAVAVDLRAEGTVRADPDLIAQVVRNLLDNARRHAGPGGHIRLSSTTGAGELIVAVDDDGPGIPPAERERVFDRFHRSEPSRDRGSGGSGLGLAISRSIVEAHGGRIWVEESPLGGARVAFALPGFVPSMRDISANA